MACCAFERPSLSKWPVRVSAGNTQPSNYSRWRDLRTSNTAGTRGSIRFAARDLPAVICSKPPLPFSRMFSQRNANTSPGRIPVPSMTVAKSRHGCGQASKYAFTSFSVKTRSRCLSPFARVILGIRSSLPHWTAREVHKVNRLRFRASVIVLGRGFFKLGCWFHSPPNRSSDE